MEVKAIRIFHDLKEKTKRFIGDVFEVTEERFKEINGSKYGILVEPLVENEEAESEFPKHTGGGWYQLSNGERVQGKTDAIAAEKELDK